MFASSIMSLYLASGVCVCDLHD